MSTLTQRLRRALDYADQHLAGDLSLASTAARVYWSPHHFHRIFLSHTGVAWGRYVRRRRLDEAAALLLDTALPASVVGARVGYRSPSAFSAAFVDEFAVTPMQVRRSGGRALGEVDRPRMPPDGQAWMFTLVEQPALLLRGHRLRCRQRRGFAEAARQAWRTLDPDGTRTSSTRIGLLDGLLSAPAARDRPAVEPAYTAALPVRDADTQPGMAATTALGRMVAAGCYATVDWQGPPWMAAYAWHRLMGAVEQCDALRLRADSAIEMMISSSDGRSAAEGLVIRRLMLPVERAAAGSRAVVAQAASPGGAPGHEARQHSMA